MFTVAAYIAPQTDPYKPDLTFQDMGAAADWAEEWLEVNGIPNRSFVDIHVGRGIHSSVMLLSFGKFGALNAPGAPYPVKYVETEEIPTVLRDRDLTLSPEEIKIASNGRNQAEGSSENQGREDTVKFFAKIRNNRGWRKRLEKDAKRDYMPDRYTVYFGILDEKGINTRRQERWRQAIVQYGEAENGNATLNIRLPYGVEIVSEGAGRWTAVISNEARA